MVFTQKIGDNINVAEAIVKPGYQTSEFWLHLLAQIGGMVLTFLPANGWMAKLAGVVVMFANPIVYTFFRVNLKKIAMDAAAAALQAIEDDVSQATPATPTATTTPHIVINMAPGQQVPNSPSPTVAAPVVDSQVQPPVSSEQPSVKP